MTIALKKTIVESTNKHSVLSFSILYPYIWRYKYLGLLAIFSLILAATVMLLVPLTSRYMIDDGFLTASDIAINSYFTILLFLAAVLGFASATRYYSVITLGEWIIADLRRDIFSHLMILSAAFYDRSHSGDILSRITSDTILIKSFVGATISVMLRNMITVIGAISMMVITSPKLSAIVLFSILAALLPLIGFSRKVRLHARSARDALARVDALAFEHITAIRTIQTFNAQTIVVNRFSDLIDLSLQAINKSILSRSFLTGFAIFLVFGSIISILWISAQDVLKGHMSSGTLGQFMLYAIFTAGSLGQLSEIGGEFAQAASATERLAELLNEKPEQIVGRTHQFPESPRGCLEFDNVSFSYPSRSDMLALNQVSFSVNQGETVAIVGPSGAGKSTVFSLLLRFYNPQRGEIYIDGVDIKKASPTDVRARIAHVAQDVTIFNGTLRKNIAFGKEYVKDRDIENAARSAYASNFIIPLKDGFDSRTGENGIMLSGGQRQRVAIARALLRDAPILLLDEATSALDAESEMLIQSALKKLMKNRTTLVIAHRLATILNADRILVMDHGKIIEQGTHDILMTQGGVYARLAKLQFTL
ncbi:MAG: bacterial [Candidatus Tokpelaia sp. JSC085]|nr:MAG: bacterial [Candidatus Tokpelaia sp. JSC085]